MHLTFSQIDYGSDAWSTAVKLRENVLRKPLDSFFSPDELEQERAHIHIGGYSDGEIVATAVLVPEGENMKMQRVAVLESLRNTAIGSKMMVFCEAIVLSNNAYTVYCHARDSAVKFYLKNGYEPEGDYFDEDGIPHLKMSKNLKKNGVPEIMSRPNILVVCGRNKRRSRTAENLFKNDSRFAIRSAGLSPKSDRKISVGDLNWADLVLVMEVKQKRKLKEMYPHQDMPVVEVLSIPDIYEFMDEVLVELLTVKVNFFALGLTQ